jgi:transcriptional regulator with XRE-family HTH domain
MPKAAKISKPKAPADPAVTAWYENFRARLVALRERKRPKLTQEGLADLLDIPLDSYKQMEGKRATRFPLHKLERLSNALGQPLEVIITGKVPRRAQDEDDTRPGRRAA